VKYAILTHGGAASPKAYSDGCAVAAEAARVTLEKGGDAFAAALEATVVLEDDPRFNAGTGSNLRLDGTTIEMDASVMHGDGRFGSVIGIERVKNPVRVAARVIETPHLTLAGAGATAFARALGFPEYDATTEGAKKKYARAVAALSDHGTSDYAVDAAPFRRPDASGAMPLARFWNFESDAPKATVVPEAGPRGSKRRTGRSDAGCDTVGAVVRDTHGRFAATASTGGTLYMLRGRVGDSGLMGCGIYAGPHGAVAATGVGEEIVRRFLAKTIYEWLAEGIAPARAASRGIALFPEVVDVGLLVIGRRGQCVASNRDMAHAQLVG
jgi:beta-aspartyl-peptidase (threonine type)